MLINLPSLWFCALGQIIDLSTAIFFNFEMEILLLNRLHFLKKNLSGGTGCLSLASGSSGPRDGTCATAATPA